MKSDLTFLERRTELSCDPNAGERSRKPVEMMGKGWTAQSPVPSPKLSHFFTRKAVLF